MSGVTSDPPVCGCVPVAQSREPVIAALAFLTVVDLFATTPLAGRLAARLGTKLALLAALSIAGAGLPMVLASHLSVVLVGLALFAVGTFLAQAVATGFVRSAAAPDAASASGLYLAAYFTGGLIGSVVLGYLFQRYGWRACVTGIGLSLLIAACLSARCTKQAVSPTA